MNWTLRSIPLVIAIELTLAMWFAVGVGPRNVRPVEPEPAPIASE